MTANSPTNCPFIASGKIDNPSYFIGYRDELNNITSSMRGAQPTSINVVGEKRVGKSSLLYHFYQTYAQRVNNPDDYAVIYLSLQDNRCQQESSFYKAIAEELSKHISNQKQSLVNKLKGKSLDRANFTEFIKKCREQGILAVLCLDKFEELFHNSEQFNNGFYDNLRSLIDGNYLMLIVASGEKLDIYSQQKKLTSDFFNLFQLISLQGLTEMEATDLVRLPAKNGVNNLQPALSEENQQIALKWGKRHPFLLQLAARYLWEAQTNQKPISWANQRFKEEAARLPKNNHHFGILGKLYLLPLNIGKAVQWIVEHQENVTNTLTGIIVIVLVIGFIILFFFKIVTFDMIKEFLDKLLGG